MNYTKIYEKLIENANNRVLPGYKEIHHIIPRCLGGSNDRTNLVELTPEEHYVAHQLLAKIHPKNEKLIRAAVMMIPNRPSNKLYGWLKRRYSSIMSNKQTGAGNISYGTMWISDVVNKKSVRIPKTELIPTSWVIGRNKWKSMIRICKTCRNEFRVEVRKGHYCSPECKEIGLAPSRRDKKYKNGFFVEVDGIKYDSISMAADNHGIGHETARMRFKSPNFPNWVICNNGV